MSTTKEYFDLFHPTCVFHLNDLSNSVCGKAAVAVYVSDDADPHGRYVCQQHAEEAEAAGDGPVFWQRTDATQGDFAVMPMAEE